MRIYECKYALDKNHDATDFPFARSAHSWRTLRLLIFYFNAKISMLKVKYYFQFIRKLFSITKGVCL